MEKQSCGKTKEKDVQNGEMNSRKSGSERICGHSGIFWKIGG